MPIFGPRYVMSQTPSHVQEFNKNANEREELLAQRDEDMRKRKEKLQILHEHISNSRRNSAISSLDQTADDQETENPADDEPELELTTEKTQLKNNTSAEKTVEIVTPSKNPSTCAKCSIQ